MKNYTGAVSAAQTVNDWRRSEQSHPNTGSQLVGPVSPADLAAIEAALHEPDRHRSARPAACQSLAEAPSAPDGPPIGVLTVTEGEVEAVAQQLERQDRAAQVAYYGRRQDQLVSWLKTPGRRQNALRGQSAVKPMQYLKALAVIERHVADHGREPTHGELARQLGVSRRAAENRLRFVSDMMAPGGAWHEAV